MRILVINPGSTSTKIAIYDDQERVMQETIQHSAEEILKFARVTDQFEMRRDLIKHTLADKGQELQFDAVIGRGSLAQPVESGVFLINDEMLDDSRNAKHQHASDLGCMLAHDIAAEIPWCLSLTADPGTVDELCDEARISGSPHCPRVSIWHALNQREVGRRFAESIDRRYEDLRLIICHMGGGISIAAHCYGRAIDTNNSLDGEGPFSPERAGSLPALELVNLSYSGRYTREELLRRIAGKAGLTAHLGTNDVRQAMQMIEDGDEHARKIVDAMIYHIAKFIASEGAVLYGNVDAVLLTGGLANCQYIVDGVTKRVEYLAPVYVYPGEFEMDALARNAQDVLNHKVKPKQYQRLNKN